MDDIVVRFKNKLKRNKVRGLALDIDETIAGTNLYWFEKLQVEFGNPENLSVKEMVETFRYTENVPYWQSNEAFERMEEYRSSDKIQRILPLIENSNTVIQKINKLLPVVLYLTNRPRTVINGTKFWLKKHNFPLVDILSRPPKIKIEDGNFWKAKVLKFLYPEIVGIIDYNPNFANKLSNRYKGTIFLYDNIDHPRRDIRVVPCKTWRDVLNKVNETYG